MVILTYSTFNLRIFSVAVWVRDYMTTKLCRSRQKWFNLQKSRGASLYSPSSPMSAARIGGDSLFTDFMHPYGKIPAMWLCWVIHLWIWAEVSQSSVKNHTSLIWNIISRSFGGSFRSVEGWLVMLQHSTEQFSTLMSWRSDFTRVDFWIT